MEQTPSLQTLVSLADTQKGYETQIADLEQDLKDIKALNRVLSTESIPNMMAQIGIQELKLTSGEKLTIKDIYSCSAREEGAYDFLKENGFGDMVKAKFVVAFDFTTDDQQAKLEKLLTEAGFEFAIKKEIHHMTFAAFAREQDKKGEDGLKMPEELFQVYHGKQSVIK